MLSSHLQLVHALSAASTRNPASSVVALLAVHGPITAVSLEIQLLTTRGSRAHRLVKVRLMLDFLDT